ncbi:hypothetical protein HGB07_03735 [Candidatus Roizmanbacteria bacterium]|nr:hypothetical protein [Candidatus Roizmanbacteria bacterium]
MSESDYLFHKIDWFSVERHQKDQLKAEVASYNENKLLNTSVDDLSNYFKEKYSIELPSLMVNSIIASQSEAKIDVTDDFRYGRSLDGRRTFADGSTVEIQIPFTGEAEALQISPTTYDSAPPRAIIANNTLILRFTGINQTSEKVKADIDRSIQSIQKYLSWLRPNVESLNSSLYSLAHEAIERRREKLLANQNLVASLGFALKENPNVPNTYTAPSVKKKIKPTPPPSSSEPYKPEPCLSEKDYNHILDVIQNMASVMERSPVAFSNMDEESLRTHFLVQLNGHYEGQATGETFNYNGKTDILIRENGKNIFIGECKFWGGKKILLETVDQLLSYSSWRDTKVAILVFNRNKDFSNVIETAHETMQGHENFKRTIGKTTETSFKYIFSHINDPNREMIISLLLFDIPIKK